MDYIIICTIAYFSLLIADIIPLVKKKRWKILSFSIPVFIITFIMDIMIGLGIDIISPNQIITNIFTSLFG